MQENCGFSWYVVKYWQREKGVKIYSFGAKKAKKKPKRLLKELIVKKNSQRRLI